MQQIRQFQDSFKSEYGGGDIVHDVWKRVNPFLWRHAKQHAHVIDIDHEPLYPASKESYRIVSVAYTENAKRQTKRMLEKYHDSINRMIKNQFRNRPIDFHNPLMGRDDVIKIVKYVQAHMSKNQAFDNVRTVNTKIRSYTVSYDVKCYQDGQAHDAVIIHGHVKF